jgi:hypothetical protein
MVNKIKALGLAFVAVAAMSAIVASSAQAGALDLGNGKTKATITGVNEASQQHNLSIPLPAGGTLNVTCPNASFEGTVEGQTDITEATVTATYGPQCKVAGLAANVRMNGCKYTLTGTGLAAGTSNVDLVGCTAGKQIEIEQVATGCIISVPEQNGLSHIVFIQQGEDATAEATVSKITNSQNAKCPTPSTEAQNASFSGNTTVQALEDQGTEQVTLHGHQYTKHKHNSVVIPITVT